MPKNKIATAENLIAYLKTIPKDTVLHILSDPMPYGLCPPIYIPLDIDKISDGLSKAYCMRDGEEIFHDNNLYIGVDKSRWTRVERQESHDYIPF